MENIQEIAKVQAEVQQTIGTLVVQPVTSKAVRKVCSSFCQAHGNGSEAREIHTTHTITPGHLQTGTHRTPNGGCVNKAYEIKYFYFTFYRIHYFDVCIINTWQ